MRLLFSGPSALVNEWTAAFRSHECLAYCPDGKKRLAADIPKISALDEAGEIDIAFNLHVAPTRRRREMIADIAEYLPAQVPIVCNTSAVTATDIGAWIGAPARVIGIAALPSLLAGPVVEAAFPYGSRCDAYPLLERLLADAGKTVEIVGDEVGLVSPRILCAIVNEAVIAMQQGVAGEDAIDTAMQLGVNYPWGPIALGRALGWKNVLAVLEAMRTRLGDDRYRPSSLLRALAATE